MTDGNRTKIVILGAGIEGNSSLNFLINLGIKDIVVADMNEKELPKDVAGVFGDNYLKALNNAKIIIRSPGIWRYSPELVAAEKDGAIITSAIKIFVEGLSELGISPCPAKIAAMTGSNGKTTCITMVHLMLQELWKHSNQPGHLILGGNIGTPVLDFYNAVQSEDLVLLELSSFQLDDLKVSPWFGAVLNITPNHLDHHPDFDSYARAKHNIVLHSGNTWAMLSEQNPITKDWIKAGPGQGYHYQLITFNDNIIQDDDAIFSGQDKDGNIVEFTMPLSDIKIKTHPETLAASVTMALKLGASIENIKSVLSTFKGVEHRLELIRVLNGVSYYEDSSNTSPESVSVALKNFPIGKTVLLLGGHDKGAEFNQLAKDIVEYKSKVVLMGQVAPKIEKAIKAVDPKYPISFQPEFQKDFQAVMEEAKNLAEPGDAVLLSTGCASFGMFNNYKHRAEEFVRIVNSF